MARKATTSENSLPALSSGKPAELPAAAAALVHEIKNPLAAIHMHLQLLEGYVDEINEADLRGKIHQKVGVLKREIVGLNKTLQDFLRILRPVPIEADLHADLARIAADTAELLEPQALRAGVELIVLHGETLDPIPADPTFVKQILINLILNSVQAYQESDLPMERRTVTISTGRRDGDPYLSVADQGPGISPDQQAKIFQPFFTTKKEGSGLGLTLVQKMAAEMGGNIELISTLGKGTEFVIVFKGTRLIESVPSP